MLLNELFIILSDNYLRVAVVAEVGIVVSVAAVSTVSQTVPHIAAVESVVAVGLLPMRIENTLSFRNLFLPKKITLFAAYLIGDRIFYSYLLGLR